jgi:cytidylate kinase
MEVSGKVSIVSEIPEVRRKLVYQQQLMRTQGGIVMDGRDIGTVVFPDAELKLFMTASPEVRAQRRFDELTKRGDKVSFAEVLKNVQDRDYIDSNREDSPLVKADDAIEIDNSKLTLTEQYQKIMHLVNMTLESYE